MREWGTAAREPPSYTRVSDDEANTMRHMVRAGFSQAEISRHLKRSYSAIRRTVKRYEIIPMPRPGTWSTADLGQLDTLHSSDFTEPAIAALLCRSRQSVSRQRRHY